MSLDNSASAVLAKQPRSLVDFQTAPFDQTEICDSTFTTSEDKELKKGICHGLSVLWIKRYCDHPSESGQQRIAFLQENIRKAAKMQNYYHDAKGAAFSPAYKKKKELTPEQTESLKELNGIEAQRVSRVKTTQEPELDKLRRRIEDIEEKYNIFGDEKRRLFAASKKQSLLADQKEWAEARERREELLNQVNAELDTIGGSQLNWALGLFKMIANQDSRKFSFATEESSAVISAIHSAVGDGPLLISLSHGSLQSCTNKKHAWSANLDKVGIRIFDPIKGEFFADLQNAGALLDALKAAYDLTGQTLFTIKASKVAKL